MAGAWVPVAVISSNWRSTTSSTASRYSNAQLLTCNVRQIKPGMHTRWIDGGCNTIELISLFYPVFILVNHAKIVVRCCERGIDLEGMLKTGSRLVKFFAVP
jgi:hypothetical protein